jgi:membrane-associated phospholipid phosphatase
LNRPAQTAPAVGEGWLGGVALRVVSCVLALNFFESGYSWGYRTHRGPGVISGVTPLDEWLPLVPEFVLFYLLGYFFVFVPCFAVRGRRNFQGAFVVFCAMLAVAFLVFRYFPVAMPKVYATGSDWFSRLTRFQQDLDTSYNTVPSLHVAANVYAFALIHWQRPDLSRWWLPVPVLIVVSTLFVKQHLVIDVITGILLAAAAFAAFRWLRALPERVTLLAYRCVMLALFVGAVIHYERFARSVRKVGRFLDAGGLTVVDLLAPAALLCGVALSWLAWRRRAPVRQHGQRREDEQVEGREQSQERAAKRQQSR